MAGLRHHSKKIIKDAVDLYQQGLSGPEIGRKLGISSRSVGRWVKQCGISRPNGGSKHKYPEIMKVAVDLYKKGIGVKEIAGKFSVKRGTVYDWMKELGINKSRVYTYGEQNPNWKNNATIKSRGIRATNDYRKWRLQVLGRECHMALHGKTKKVAV